MSTEIFINSFYIASKAIISNPFGYGINSYREAFDKHHKTSQTYTDRFVNVLNREDGSNNLAKIITEFGLFSIVFFVYSIILFFSKNYLTMRKYFYLIYFTSNNNKRCWIFNSWFYNYFILHLLFT